LRSSLAAMGEQLYLSINTVKAYLKSLYRKLDARTRDEAVAAARRAGLL
jgi:LuxR family maltose regulon positive regulatory protein